MNLWLLSMRAPSAALAELSARASVPDSDFGLWFSCSYNCRPRDSTVRKSNSRIALACVDPAARAASAATTIARIRLKIPLDLRIRYGLARDFRSVSPDGCNVTPWGLSPRAQASR